MTIRLSDHFTYKKLLRFIFPSVIMLVFTSAYTVVDGFFVSNFVGKASFTAVNFIIPVLMILSGFGFMFGTGGSALISKTMGEGDNEKANRLFSLIIYTSVILGIVISVLGIIFIHPLAALLGAKGRLLNDSVVYGRIILMAIPAYVLQVEFQCLFATAGKPALGLFVTVAAGLTNILLDALFIAVFDMELIGAAAATAIGQCVGGIAPLIYFSLGSRSSLRLGKTVFDAKALLQICLNGSSEMMNNISMSLISMLYNVQLLKYAGEDGIAAYGVLMYVGLIFLSIFIGYSVGVAPIIGFHYGAQNNAELKALLKKSLILTGIFAVIMFSISYIFARPLSYIFTGYDGGLFNLTVHAFSFFSFSFLFSGYAIFGSSFFTALNNGPVSAAISFMRTMIFQVAAVIVFPLIWKTDGIWMSIVAAEIAAVAVTALFLKLKQKKYNY